MMSLQGVLFCLTLFIIAGEAQLDFGYDGENGPDHWAELFPTCGGQRQSPVDIRLRRARKTSSPALWLSHPGLVPWEATLTNTGHSAQVELGSARPITLHGGRLRAPYVFRQLHFHWGRNDSVGSEHAVNSDFSSMEMHVVFYNEEYGSPSNASNYKDGFAVLAVFLDVNADGTPVLQPIAQALKRVPEAGDVTTLDTRLALESLLPNRMDLYYTYQGSLTTPPCDEAVIWIVFYQQVPVSGREVAAFRTLMAEDGGQLIMNRRPLQPLGRRTISRVHVKGRRPRDAPTRSGGNLRITRRVHPQPHPTIRQLGACIIV